jgi:hypothetical protein
MARSKMFMASVVSALGSNSPSSRRRVRGATPKLDSLEGRVVLSHFSHHAHHFAARMNAPTHVSAVAATTATPVTTAAATSTTTASVGTPAASTATTVATTTTPTTSTTSTNMGGWAGDGPGGPGGPGGTQDAQLTTDLQKLQTDLKADVAGSTVTDAQRYALGNDIRTITQAGVTIDRTALKTVADNLLTALADGTYDSSADKAAAIKTAFAAAFTGTSVDQTQVTQAYTDFVAVARGLNLTSAELTTQAADNTAIQADFTRLGIGTTGDHGPGASGNIDLILGGFGGRGGPGFGGRGGPGFGGRGGPGFGGHGIGGHHGGRF